MQQYLRTVFLRTQIVFEQSTVQHRPVSRPRGFEKTFPSERPNVASRMELYINELKNQIRLNREVNFRNLRLQDLFPTGKFPTTTTSTTTTSTTTTHITSIPASTPENTTTPITQISAFPTTVSLQEQTTVIRAISLPVANYSSLVFYSNDSVPSLLSNFIFILCITSLFK